MVITACWKGGFYMLQWLFLGNFILAFTPFLHHGGIEPYESV